MLAVRLGMPPITLHRWVRSGVLTARMVPRVPDAIQRKVLALVALLLFGMAALFAQELELHHPHVSRGRDRHHEGARLADLQCVRACRGDAARQGRYGPVPPPVRPARLGPRLSHHRDRRHDRDQVL